MGTDVSDGSVLVGDLAASLTGGHIGYITKKAEFAVPPLVSVANRLLAVGLVVGSTDVAVRISLVGRSQATRTSSANVVGHVQKLLVNGGDVRAVAADFDGVLASSSSDVAPLSSRAVSLKQALSSSRSSGLARHRGVRTTGNSACLSSLSSTNSALALLSSQTNSSVLQNTSKQATAIARRNGHTS